MPAMLVLIISLLFSSAPGIASMPAEPEQAPTQATSAKRIILLFPQVLGILFILDLAADIVALPQKQAGVNGEKLGKFYAEMAPGLAKAVDVGQSMSPNIESLLKADPDLILASKAYTHTDMMLKVAQENRIPILKLEGGFGNIEEWLAAVDSVAQATGRTEKASRYAEFFRQRLKLVQDRLADVPEAQRPRVVLINTAGTQMVIRGGRTTYGYELITAAGGQLLERGEDPADSAGCAELLFKFDPDIIIDDSKIDIFYRASWWNSLRAVKEGRIYKTPADDDQAWMTNWFLSAYSPVGILWLAKKIHPEKFADIDLQAEHEAFCRLLYGRPFVHAGDGFR